MKAENVRKATVGTTNLENFQNGTEEPLTGHNNPADISHQININEHREKSWVYVL
jgi:hypothetical protein